MSTFSMRFFVLFVCVIIVSNTTGTVITIDGVCKPYLQQSDVDQAINQLYEAVSANRSCTDMRGKGVEHWGFGDETAWLAYAAMRWVFSLLGALDRYHFKADVLLRAADVPGVPAHGGADGMYEVHGDPPFDGYLNRYGEADCRPIDLVLAYGHAGLVKTMLDDFEHSSMRCAGQDATWAPCCTRAWYTPSKCAASLTGHEKLESLLHMVAEVGRADLVPILLRHCPDDTWFDPNQHCQEMHQTPLHSAVRRNQPEVVRELLKDSRVYPNCICKYTPLHEAIAFGHEMVTAVLLDDPRVDITRALDGFGLCTWTPMIRLARKRLEERQQGYMAKDDRKRQRDDEDGKDCTHQRR